jgi:tRNA-uridine 2-sulfurtransferase
MMEKNKRVLLGMSGGTDSSVAAMLLLEAGYEVTGFSCFSRCPEKNE